MNDLMDLGIVFLEAACLTEMKEEIKKNRNRPFFDELQKFLEKSAKVYSENYLSLIRTLCHNDSYVRSNIFNMLGMKNF
jgi:hypothetical protein